MKDVLIIFGEGGHAEQMKRLLGLLQVDPARCIGVVDRKGISAQLASEEWVVAPLREKYGWSSLSILGRVISLFVTALKIQSRYQVETVISTGPGISIVPAFVFRLLGRKIVHIETWSRFESRSHTGRFMYRIANKFYVQNQSLLRLYPRATYSGRL